jgi:hypothetical protein
VSSRTSRTTQRNPVLKKQTNKIPKNKNKIKKNPNPNQTKPNQTKPNQTKPNQTEPNKQKRTTTTKNPNKQTKNWFFLLVVKVLK